MKTMMILQNARAWLGLVLTLSLLSVTPWGHAAIDPKGQSPHRLVEEVTREMFAIVEKYDGGPKNSDRYHQEITQLLEPVVDFEFIAQAVMGSYRKDASDEQTRRFAEIFKKGLVKTYAKGIAGYVDSEIKVLPPSDEDANKRRISVYQEVRHEGSKHQLSYTMVQNRADEWKLINLVLDGVNLGKSFRSQFQQSAKQQNGNLDKVIDTWLDEV